MKSSIVFAVIAMCFTAPVIAAQTPTKPVNRCTVLAGKFHVNPFQMKLTELDEFQICANESIKKAQSRNFGDDGYKPKVTVLTDAE